MRKENSNPVTDTGAPAPKRTEKSIYALPICSDIMTPGERITEYYRACGQIKNAKAKK